LILYKYLQPARVDVLKHRRIRFTQPGDFNDPFEFRPRIAAAASDASTRQYVETNFERLLDEELAKYSALSGIVPKAMLRELLLAQKDRLPALFGMLEPQMLPRVSLLLESLLNQKVGVLCLSEVRDSILMWGHYTDNHRGFVVGFDSEHSFFSKRRSEQDEFGFLRRVDYQQQRPNTVLSDTSSHVWFQTKAEPWAYEKEWRVVRVLSEADSQIGGTPFPVSLFEFPADAVMEVIVGLRSTPQTIHELRSMVSGFPGAVLLAVSEDPDNYGLLIDEVRP
jgi:hypothetical protein